MAARRRRGSSEERIAGEALGSLLSTRAGRRTLLVLVLLAGIAYGGWWLWQRQHRPPPITVTPGTSIRLATWNLKQFSIERTGTDLRMIANIITSAQFDLVAIQEVKREGEEVDRLLNVLGPPWRGTSFSPMTGNHERFVFIYRADRLQEVGRPHLIDSPDAGIFDRVPYQAGFRAGQFDFTLVTVHLSYTDTLRRQREAEALARFARDMAAHEQEKDIIVLGDFNEQGQGNLHYLEANGWQTVIKEPTNLGSRNIFDHLLINPLYTREWSHSSGVVRFDEIYYRNDDKTAANCVSDHRPAYGDFSTLGPDDD